HSELQRLTNDADAQGHQATGQNAQYEHQRTVDGHDAIGDHTVIDGADLAFGLVEVRHLDHTQVVEGTDQGHDHGEHGHPDVARANQRLQHGQLGVEARHGGNAREREHGNEQHGGHERAAAVQTLEVGNILALKSSVTQQHDHAER